MKSFAAWLLAVVVLSVPTMAAAQTTSTTGPSTTTTSAPATSTTVTPTTLAGPPPTTSTTLAPCPADAEPLTEPNGAIGCIITDPAPPTTMLSCPTGNTVITNGHLVCLTSPIQYRKPATPASQAADQQLAFTGSQLLTLAAAVGIALLFVGSVLVKLGKVRRS